MRVWAIWAWAKFNCIKTGASVNIYLTNFYNGTVLLFTLLDADWSLNAGNWMWLSASAFFHQYFRVYSPVAFGKKTDKNGDYIRYLQLLFSKLFCFSNVWSEVSITGSILMSCLSLIESQLNKIQNFIFIIMKTKVFSIMDGKRFGNRCSTI